MSILTSLVPTQDAIQEFRVQTNNSARSSGAWPVARSNLTTRFGFQRIPRQLVRVPPQQVLNANTFFNNKAGGGAPRFTQNQYGGRIGGPVKKGQDFLLLQL